jgi:Divergent InlB B-repeat domain
MSRRSKVLLPLSAATASLVATLLSGHGQASAAPAEVTLTGVYTLVHHDTRPEKTVPFLQVGSHRLVRLHFGANPHYRLNSRLTLTGVLRGNDMQVSAADAGAVVAPGVPTGNHTVLIMRVYWGSPDAVTDAQAVNQVGGTDNSYYQENSYQQLSLSATATSWLTIAQPTTCDDIGAIQSSAYSAAVNAGYNPDLYDHDMVYVSSADCSGRGWGEIGGKWTWIQGTMNNYRTAHELGHNLGLFHSHSLVCPAGTSVADTCTMNEYGDIFDVMGYPWSGEAGLNDFNAYQKQALGWLGSRTQVVSTSGRYVVAPYESSASGIQVLRITTPSHVYFIENRSSYGFDSDLPTGATSGAVMHIADASNGSDLLDMTPSGSFSDAALPVGSSWTDPEGVFTLSVNGDTAAGLSTYLQFGGPATDRLSVAKFGTGAGTVTSSPAGINCGTTCSHEFGAGLDVTLTAAAAQGSVFAGWSGACAGTALTCTVSMTSARDATATFNTSSTTTKYEEMGSLVNYNGWKAATDTPNSGGAYRYSATTGGGTATFTFTGTAVTWLTRKGPASGIANVTIDGINKGNLDLYAASKTLYSKAYTGLANASHNIVVKVTGTHNAASTGNAVIVDGFTVGATTTQESGRLIMYDTWKGSQSVNASGGEYRASASPSASVTVSFTGTRIDWVTSTGTGWGIANVVIDGVNKGNVDLYSSTTTWQSVKTYSGLSNAAHSMTVKPTGTKNSSSTTAKVPIDAFVVY